MHRSDPYGAETTPHAARLSNTDAEYRAYLDQGPEDSPVVRVGESGSVHRLDSGVERRVHAVFAHPSKMAARIGLAAN